MHIVTWGEARQDCLSQCNAGADVVQARMWCVVPLGEARHDCFSQCNAGADVAQGHMWVEAPIEKEKVDASIEKKRASRNKK